jgi:pimeloyl-ACP methyl ester carboxylesterase
MGRGWKILIGVLVVLAALLGVNALVVDSRTEEAEVTVPHGRILELPEGDVQVVDRGPRDASPIVLVHCFTCSLGWWDAMAPLLVHGLRGEPHRVVAIDLRGFGGSEKPSSGYSMENQADLVAAAMERLGIREATVAGHSLGGTVVTALAERSPELVDGVVIVDQAPNNGDEYEKDGLPFSAALTFVPVLGEGLWQVTPDFAIEDGLGAAFAPGYDVPDRFVDEFKRMTYTSYDSAPDAEDDYTDESGLDTRLGQAAVPVLAIFGEEEQIYDSPAALAAYARIPGAQTVLVPEAGHSPNVERPAETAGLVLRFAARTALARHAVQKGVQNENPVRPRP